MFVTQAGEMQGAAVPLYQRPRGDHLADIEPRAEAATEAAKRSVRDPRHRCEDYRGIDAEGSDLKGRELPGGCRGRAGVQVAAVVARNGAHATRVVSLSTA